MAAREQRHAPGSRRRLTRQMTGRSSGSKAARIIGWIADGLVVLLIATAFAQVQLDLSHRWLGLDRPDPKTEPGQVAAPVGLDLPAGIVEPPVADPIAPGAVDPAAVRRALAPYAGSADLGGHIALQVVDLSNDKVVFKRGAGAAVPASTMKLLTSTAALATLGPGARFSTRVVRSANKIVLVGGGDPFLASTQDKGKGGYPIRADLTTLATKTAAALARSGIRKVTLSYDDTLFTGPAVNPKWPATYVPENVVPPITALWTDEALDSSGHYVADPSRTAADVFATALRKAKIAVVGTPTSRKAPSSAVAVASVSSAPVGEIVQQTLAVSDNTAAEVLSRHVGAAVAGDASFVGGAQGVFDVLRGLGVNLAGSRTYDGSGLSRSNKLTANTLMGVLKVASSEEHPKLREVITGLPVSGFTGSLQRRFAKGPAEARGRVLAKTGTLTGVHSLAGIATDLDGNLMGFVFLSDQVAVGDTLDAQHDLDLMAGALGACRCGV